MWFVVGVNNEMATSRLIVSRSEPIHHEINNLRAEMPTFVLYINSKLGQQYSGVVNQPFLMMHLTANLLLSCIGQLLGEDACISYSETCNDFRRLVGETEIIGLAKQFILIVLCFVVEELVNRSTTAIERLYVQFGIALSHKLQVNIIAVLVIFQSILCKCPQSHLSILSLPNILRCIRIAQ